MRPLGSLFYTLVVERKLAKFHPWILAGLWVLYFFTFPFLHNPLWVTVPVAVSGWFLYRKGGFWAGVAGFFVDLYLIDTYMYSLDLGSITRFENGILLGHVLVLSVGLVFGYLRMEIEDLYHNNQRLISQERVLILVNMAVRDILEKKDIDDGSYRLINNITNLFVADYGYLVHWDASSYRAVVLASTTSQQDAEQKMVLEPAQSGLIMSVMESSHILFLEQAQASKLVMNSPIFHSHQPLIESVLVIPLTTRDYFFGAVVLGFDTPRQINQDELSYFELTSAQITLALKTVLQEQKIGKQLKEVRALASIEHALGESEKVGLDAVLQLIVNSARDLIPNTSHAVLHLLDQDQQLLIPRAVSGDFAGRKSNLNMHLGEGVAGQVLSTGESVTIADIWSDDRFINRTLPTMFRSMAAAPVLLNEKRIGTISVLGPGMGSFQQDEVELLTSLGTLSAIAIENAAHYESMQTEIEARIKVEDALRDSIASERELRLSAQTTAEASFALVSKLDEGEVLDEVLEQVEKLLPNCAYNIQLLDDGQYLTVKAHRGFHAHGNELGHGDRYPVQFFPLIWGAVQDRRIVVVADSRTEPGWITTPQYEWVRSYLCIPLVWKDQLLGVLNIDHEQPNMFSEQVAERLNALVNVAAAAIANAQLLENIQDTLNEISALYHISRELAALNVNELLTATVELLQKNFGYYHVQVFLYDPERGDLVLQSASGEIGRELLERKHRLPSGDGIIGHTFRTSNPFVTSNVEEVSFFSRNPLLPGTKSELTVPLKIGEKTLGVLDVQQSLPNVLTPRDLKLVSAVADQLSVALYNANLYEDLQSALDQEQTMRFQLMKSERLAMVGRLLASISHELNNPLQAIQNVLFLLKDEESLSAQGREDLEVILSETERMTSLIGRLRATYRTPVASEFIPVQMNSLVEDIYALTATYMRHKSIVFEFIPDGTDALALGIPDQIRQVLLNLFMNAIDAMPTGGRISVRIEQNPVQGNLSLTVTDTGPGIAPAILPNIFEPFTTDKDTGTGLGMTIARDIILQHRGEISAQNIPGGGAMFTILLPVAKKE